MIIKKTLNTDLNSVLMTLMVSVSGYRESRASAPGITMVGRHRTVRSAGRARLLMNFMVTSLMVPILGSGHCRHPLGTMGGRRCTRATA